MRNVIQMRRRHCLGSITWGTRTRALGTVLDLQPAIVSPMNTPASLVMGTISQEPSPQITPFVNPDTRPGAWPGLTLNPPAPEPAPQPQVFTGTPGQVPVVVTPTSGPIPSPGTVAAATSAPASWLDQSLIAGIPNKFLLLGGLGAFLLFGGKKK